MFSKSSLRALSLAAAAVLVSGSSVAQNWTTDGGDTVRSGWAKDEKVLTPANVKQMKLLWTVQTDVAPRALHALMTPLILSDVPTSAGKKEMMYVLGVSDTLYAIDVATHQIAWQKHFTYEALQRQRPPADVAAAAGPGVAAAAPGAGAPNGPAQQQAQAGVPPAAGAPPAFQGPREPADPRHLNFLNPGGSTAVPVIGPPAADGHRPIYVMDGGGNLHTLDTVDGKDMRAIIKVGTTSKFALQLYDNKIIFGAGNGINSADALGAGTSVQKTLGFGGGGGLWGRRGPTITSDGTIWTTTGDGQYDPDKSTGRVIGNSVVGFHKVGDHWEVKDWFTPANWAWLLKRDLDPNNTPTVFNFKGRELMAASGKECRVYLLDPKNAGGPDHHEPLYKSGLTCNEAVDFQNAGSWGALSSWEDPKGTRWVIQPFWGPAHSQAKFPIMNTPKTVEGGQAAYKVVEKNGKPELEPVWISRDMYRGDPPIIANGMIFAYGAGDNTQQAWSDIGLNFDSSIRAAKSGHATIYVLDAYTGKELWTSGDQIKTFSHFSSLTVSNGKVYIGTYDGLIYCFGLPS